MIQIGVRQSLTIVSETTFGVYLADEENKDYKVLLPRKQVPKEAKVGDALDVFVYRDSDDRLIATVNTPFLTLGETARLTVKQVTKIGAFLDWGLEKDLLLPFHEQTFRVAEGETCLAALYLDKSSRLCATMKVYPYLRTDSPYGEGDRVEGVVYDKSDNFGMFVAVDDRYSGLIPKKEVHGGLEPGRRVSCRVTSVRPDGKLNLSHREKAYLQMDEDAALVLETINAYDGVLPFNDKASPRIIERETGLSKAAFKRAVGRLLKQGRISITPTGIRKL